MSSKPEFTVELPEDGIVTEERIEEVAAKLEFVEEWLAKTNTAGSALGRQVLQDQAAISRWRTGGIHGCSYEKRRSLAIFVLEHPEGIPGHKPARSGKRGPRGQTNQTFQPGKSPSSSRIGRLQEGTGQSTPIPVPSLEELESKEDMEWVRSRAFSNGVPLTRVLAEMVLLGIRCQREIDFEETVEQISLLGKDEQ